MQKTESTMERLKIWHCGGESFWNSVVKFAVGKQQNYLSFPNMSKYKEYLEYYDNTT